VQAPELHRPTWLTSVAVKVEAAAVVQESAATGVVVAAVQGVQTPELQSLVVVHPLLRVQVDAHVVPLH